MTATTTTSVTEAIYEELIGGIDSSLKNLTVMRQLMDVKVIGNQATTKHSFPYVEGLNNAAAPGSEGAATDSQEFTLADAVATAAVKQLAVEVTKMASRSTTSDFKAKLDEEMMKACAQAFDVEAAALVAAFSNTVGSTTVDMSMSTLMAAIAKFDLYAKDHAINPVCILYSQHWHDMINEAIGGTGFGLSQLLSRDQFFNIIGDNPGTSLFGSMRGSIGNCPILVSNNLATMNAGADYGSGIFAAGGALGAVVKWETEIDEAPLTAQRKASHQYLANLAYGVIEKRDALGVTIIADA